MQPSVEASLLFLFCVFLSLALGFIALNKNEISRRNLFLIESAIVFWLVLHHLLGRAGVYQNFDAVPPRILIFVFIPITAIIIFLLFTRNDELQRLFSLEKMMWLHIVRIPVEIVLWRLFLEGFMPEAMSFEGRNFDILAGITAPIAWLLAFRLKWIGRNGLLIWNVISLALLLNIVTLAILSAPGPLQSMAFDQPNIGVSYTPIILLPAFVAPQVLFFHLISIAKLLRLDRNSEII